MTRTLAILAALLLGAGFCACSDNNLVHAPPLMQVGVDHLDFGAVAVGDAANQGFTIQNQGRGPLTFSTAFSGDGADAFEVNPSEGRVTPGVQSQMQVTFRPSEVRHYDDILTISGNDPQHPTAEVLLSGDGYRRGAIEVDPLLVDFGLVNAGSAGLGQVNIRNVGNGDLTVTGITLSSDTNTDYVVLSSTRTPATIPEGSTVPLDLAYRPGANSVPPGDGQLFITAADPFQPNTTVTLKARLNRAPIASAGGDQQVDPLQIVTLDGSGSTDPDGDLPLTFAWGLVQIPGGSQAVLSDPASPTPTFVPDLVGVYQAELWVTDSTGLRSLSPSRAVVTARPAERLLIELVWDSPIADLDLHLLAPGGTLGSLSDCFWGNPVPDWGVTGDSSDDPKLLRDDLMGFGPETIAYNKPIDGLYQLVAVYYASHTPTGTEPTTATLRVFVDGFLKAEITDRLDTQGQSWNAATVQWPEGIVTAQNQGP